MSNSKLALEGGKPIRDKMLSYGRQVIDQDDIQAVIETLNSDWLTTGPKVAEFEMSFAASVGAKHAVAVSNGTAALHVALFAAGIGPGAEVITTPFTFVATANAARYMGGNVKFADIRPDSYNIDPNKIEELINKKTKAILAVDFAGHPADLQAGSYLKEISIDQAMKANKEQVGVKLAAILKELAVNCICEAGVGEATTLGHLLPHIKISKTFGFDISMSRLFYSQQYLKINHLNVDLFCAEISKIPFVDNAIECIYTFHSLEPNGGKEKRLLTELLRVTQKYLILIEPDYDHFSEEQKNRMDQHGYCKNLRQYLSELNAKIIYDQPWELDSYELNRASIIILEKNSHEIISSQEVSFVSPISFKPLTKVKEGFFCEEDGFLFPSIKNIPVFFKK